MSDFQESNIMSQLPNNIINRMDGSNQETVDEFMRSKLPVTHHNEIAEQLDRHFVLGKDRDKYRLRRKNERQVRKERCGLKMSERRKLGLHKLPKKGLKYADVKKQMHSLWYQYMRKLLDIDFLKENRFTGRPTDKHWETVNSKLIKADLHGALVTIKSSKSTSLVGKEGIIVVDSRNCFQIIGKDNVLKTIPKLDCEFCMMLDGLTITFFGKDMCARPGDRIAKRHKTPIYNYL